MRFLYIGGGTCLQFWRFGLNGGIPNHLCNVVQYYAKDTCGCDVNVTKRLNVNVTKRFLDDVQQCVVT